MSQPYAAQYLDHADTQRFQLLLDRLAASLEADRRAVERAAAEAEATVAAAVGMGQLPA
ncbi:hypothetical protein CFP65_0129 [Kitasatospora sp. MMS16-BH015]|uniref:hypothetical protein n=1 Tax=Kitasatospora sp. MMS16-BH015 TaxID=2018025 RepID=UPI000CA0BF6A|nr:hypothetical protein [Kitasatospora sp. MMS16-BH015]AUG75113.1 hypothetical protein CFP65_0129 [Kitasatospora sp. MMS16-BH015]